MDQNPMNDLPGVPPPPAEVKVRTMRSDLESMAKSGGGLPQFQTVTIAGLPVEHATSAARTVAPAASAPVSRVPEEGGAVTPTSSGSSRNLIGIVLVIVVAMIAIGVVGYFAYTYLGNSNSAAPTSTATGTP